MLFRSPGSPAPAPGPGSGRSRPKPPTSTARTRRARKSQPRGHFPGAAAAGGPTRPRARRPGAAPLSSGRTAHAGPCVETARAAGPPGQARSQTGRRVGGGATARQTPTASARPRPSLTCLHRVREVVRGGRGPGKFLQFPGTEVQAPGVGRFLQRALQPPVQGQVEAAAAARGPAAGSGSSVVVVVVGMMVRVQRSRRQGRHEGLGFASRRRHLLPGAPAPPRRSCGGRSHLSPGTGDSSRGRVPAALRREMPGRAGGCGRRAEPGAERRRRPRPRGLGGFLSPGS